MLCKFLFLYFGIFLSFNCSCFYLYVCLFFTCKFAKQYEWEDYLLWLTDEGGGGILWREGNLPWFEDRYVRLLLALWITKLQESVGGLDAQSKRGRDLHITGSESANLTRSTVSTKLFANSCARQCLSDDCWQFFACLCLGAPPFFFLYRLWR